jgi:hypothetical protein
MEQAAIVHAKAGDGRWWLDNKAEDARGLAIRRHLGNSFLYVCTASSLRLEQGIDNGDGVWRLSARS